MLQVRGAAHKTLKKGMGKPTLFCCRLTQHLPFALHMWSLSLEGVLTYSKPGILLLVNRLSSEHVNTDASSTDKVVVHAFILRLQIMGDVLRICLTKGIGMSIPFRMTHKQSTAIYTLYGSEMKFISFILC